MEKLTVLHVVHIITKLEMGGAQKVCLTLKKGLDDHHHWAGLISGTDGTLRQSAEQMIDHFSMRLVMLSRALRSISYPSPGLVGAST